MCRSLRLPAVSSPGVDPVDAVNYDTDVTIPKIDLSFDLKTDVFFVNAFLGYQTFDLESSVVGQKDVSIDSTVFGVGGGANFGPMFVKAGVHAGSNLGDFGAYNPLGMGASAVITPATGKVEDNDALGYLLVVGFKAGDAATIEAGYGYQEYDSGSCRLAS